MRCVQTQIPQLFRLPSASLSIDQLQLVELEISLNPVNILVPSEMRARCLRCFSVSLGFYASIAAPTTPGLPAGATGGGHRRCAACAADGHHGPHRRWNEGTFFSLFYFYHSLQRNQRAPWLWPPVLHLDFVLACWPALMKQRASPEPVGTISNRHVGARLSWPV